MNDQTPFIGRSMTRREDRRLLTGRGQYIADLELPHMLHAVLVRSPQAHARIKAIDMSRAATASGVAFVLTGPELARVLPPVSDTQLALPSKWTALVQHKFINPQQPLLAHDKVRHVGEAVAVIVAANRYAAEDAAQLVELDLEPLPPVLDPEQALDAGATIVHDKFSTNLIGAFTVGKGDADAVLKRAPRRLQRRFYHHRYVALPMECRGVVGLHDARTDTVTIWSATQVVHWLKREAAGVLRLPEAKIRCVALDVGGGFGVKGHVYPEDLLIPYLARRLGRPVKWIEDRHEHMLCSCHSRDQIHDVEIGFDETAASWRCAIILSSIAAPGIRSEPVSPTTPRSTCRDRTRSAPSPYRAASQRPTKCRTRRIAAPAVPKRRLPWSAASISSPRSLASSRQRCGCAT